MVALLLIPILVCGYIVTTRNPWHKLRLHRYEGQLLYLSSARLGISCTFLGFCLLAVIQSLTPSDISISSFTIPYLNWSFDSRTIPLDIGKQIAEKFVSLSSQEAVNEGQENQLFALRKDAAQLSWIIQGSILSILVANAWHVIAIRHQIKKIRKSGLKSGLKSARLEARRKKRNLSKEEKKKIKSEAKYGYMIYLVADLLKESPMGTFLYNSYIEGFILVLGMNNRKVYVGRVYSMGEPTEEVGMDQEIVIVPYFSGHERADTLQVVLQHDLSDVESLTLRQENIVYAHYYKPNYQAKIHPEKSL